MYRPYGRYLEGLELKVPLGLISLQTLYNKGSFWVIFVSKPRFHSNKFPGFELARVKYQRES